MKLVYSAPVLALAAGQALASASGSFNVLSINVAGLPAIFNGNDVPGDKATNSRAIGSYFVEYGYEIIHMQEDFNYHAYIYETDNHPYRTATTGGAGIGSGLNTLAGFSWSDFTRIRWDDCSNASGADCLTPKGFTFMRLKVDDGVFIDAYNLHTDAGTEDDDLTARNSNLHQVASYIDTWSVGNAVLVFGDTNSRYSRVADDIRVFGTQCGLIDAWVELVRAGIEPSEPTFCDNPSTTNDCETVDKIFYRGNIIIDLSAAYFNYESSKFLQGNGDILTDHNPISVGFNWTLSARLQQSSFWGGPHGDWLSDLPVLGSIESPKPSVIAFRGGSRLDSVGLTLADGTTFGHGGDGGSLSTLTLGSGEYWTSAVLCRGQKSGRTRNFYAEARTSAGNTVAAGTRTDDCNTFTAPDGWHIVGYLGRSGDEMDQVAFIYAPQ